MAYRDADTGMGRRLARRAVVEAQVKLELEWMARLLMKNVPEQSETDGVDEAKRKEETYHSLLVFALTFAYICGQRDKEEPMA